MFRPSTLRVASTCLRSLRITPMRALPSQRLMSTAAAAHSHSTSTSTSTSTLPRNLKASTMLTGLPVVPNASEVLVALYQRTIEEAKQYGLSINYNQHIVRICEYRLKAVQSAKTVEEYESVINCGCAEELIEQAEDELDLLKTMNETVKPWELDPETDLEIEGAPEPFGVRPEHYIKFTNSPFTPAPSTDASTAAAGSVAHTGHSIPGKPATPDTTASPQTKQTKTNP